MTTLATVQLGLRKLRRLRATVRLGSAAAVVATLLLWALAGAFALDYWLRMGRFERGIVLGAWVALAAWAVARWLVPALLARESDVDLALLVERQQGLSSDLVAAIQFAEPARRQYGSDDLREAVVECTAEASGSLDFLEGFSRQRLTRRAGVLAVTVALLVLPAALFAGHSGAFLRRMFLLSRAHYPTRTRIVRILSPAGPRAAYGRDVRFQVLAGGEIPPAGVVEIRAAGSNMATTVDLLPDANDPAVFAGRLPRVLDDLTYVIRLGDAFTEPMDLRMIPLPLVKVDLDVAPPAYTAGRVPRGGSGRAPVPEGSRVVLRVSADRRLSAGRVRVDAAEWPLRPTANGALALDPGATVFDRVTRSVRYRVWATDADGLGPERPITGVVQVLPDRPPRIAAGAVTRHVLPTAAPRIAVRALDDYGLARLRLRAEVARPDANTVATTWTIAEPADRPAELAVTHELGLAGLGLAKGDRVTVTVEAVDHRGDAPGQSAVSDPLTFLVTDRRGLLEAMRTLDDRAVEKLDEIIKAQLGIGE